TTAQSSTSSIVHATAQFSHRQLVERHLALIAPSRRQRQPVASAVLASDGASPPPRGRAVCRLSGLDQRYAPHDMSFKRGEHFASKTADLLKEHLLGHRASIEADQHRAGTRMISRCDDAFGDFLGRSPRHVLGLSRYVIHSHIAKVL